jgi:3-deoxy-D-manno-octulosonic-acid transferase
MTWLYNLGISFYSLAARIKALGNEKAKLWVEGRENLLPQIEDSCKNLFQSIWIHCPSLGEFEQGRPVLEALRQKHPDVPIVLTFFSPSGYEVRKNYAGADFVFYLPTDNRENAKSFITAIKPRLAVFVKYDFWLHHLAELKLRKCPTILVSGIFRPDQHFFKPWGGIGKKMLNCFDHFFVQDANSQQLLKSIGFNNVTISGDTRFDRVTALQKEASEIKLAKDFSKDFFTVIAGSTWPQDEIGLAAWINQHPDARLIIAPHQISESGIHALEKLFECPAVRFSKVPEVKSQSRVLIIDNIGLLSSLYQYASVAYVGGGFGHGVHNTLEAAVWQVPIVFGPNHQKFKEARDLVSLGAAMVAAEPNIIGALFSQFKDDETSRLNAGITAKNYVEHNTGATVKIIGWITQSKILLSNN